MVSRFAVARSCCLRLKALVTTCHGSDLYKEGMGLRFRCDPSKEHYDNESIVK